MMMAINFVPLIHYVKKLKIIGFWDLYVSWQKQRISIFLWALVRSRPGPILPPRPRLAKTKLYSPKTSSMTGDMRKEAVTRAAARIMKVRAPLVTIAVAVFLFCLSMSP